MMVMINKKLALEAKSAPTLAPHPPYQTEGAPQLFSSRHCGPHGRACWEKGGQSTTAAEAVEGTLKEIRGRV